jgi:hypothetical protein
MTVTGPSRDAPAIVAALQGIGCLHQTPLTPAGSSEHEDARCAHQPGPAAHPRDRRDFLNARIACLALRGRKPVAPRCRSRRAARSTVLICRGGSPDATRPGFPVALVAKDQSAAGMLPTPRAHICAFEGVEFLTSLYMTTFYRTRDPGLIDLFSVALFLCGCPIRGGAGDCAYLGGQPADGVARLGPQKRRGRHAGLGAIGVRLTADLPSALTAVVFGYGFALALAGSIAR